MYRSTKMTKEERLLFSKAADDADSILIMSYNLMKFLADIKAMPSELKSMNEVIEKAGSLRDSLKNTLKWDEDKK